MSGPALRALQVGVIIHVYSRERGLVGTELGVGFARCVVYG